MTLNDYLLYILAGVAGMTLLIGLIFGLRRGLLRSTIRTALLVGCAVGAFLISRWAIITYEPAIEEVVIPYIEVLAAQIVDLLEASPTLVTYLVDLACALLAPFMYLIIFYVLKLVTWLVYLFITLLLPKPWKKKAKAKSGEGEETKPKRRGKYSFLSRLCGAVVSTAGAAVIVISLIMPVAGYLDFAREMYPQVEASGVLGEDVTATLASSGTSEQLASTENNIILKTVKTYGGSYLFDHLTAIGESESTLGKKLSVMLEMIPAVQKLSSVNFGAIFAENEAPDLSVIDEEMLPILHKSEWMETILAEMMSTAATKWEAGETFLGIDIKGQLPPEHAGALDGVLRRLKSTSQTRVVQDLADLTATVELVGEAFTYMNNVANPSNITTEELQEHMRDIMNNLTPGSAELLGSALSDEMVGAAGLSEESSKTVQEMITTALTTIAEQSTEEREAESDAINALISYTSEDRRADVTADEIVDTLLSSQVVKNVITEQITPDENGETGSITVTEEQKTAIDAAIEAKMLEASESQDEDTLAFLETLAGFFATVQP